MIQGIGIDFGTTNSVVALARTDGTVEAVTWPTSHGGAVDLFRTALYFWSEGRAPRAKLHNVAGPAALEHALAGTREGRFVQSIKTYLASAAFKETHLFARRFGIEQLVATFLTHLAEDGGTDPRGVSGARIVGGRPVVFAGERPDEALAVARLHEAYRLAGFPAIDLAYEPLGAAYWYARGLVRDETLLVADFGGGTSDFSVIRFSQAGGCVSAEPLAHAGVGVAGDTFDYRLVDHLVAPQLGKGSLYRSFDKRLPFPAYVHAAFAQWHQLSWLKTSQTMRELHALAAASEVPDAIEKLIAFLDLDLGFELYQAVGELKRRLSEADEAELEFSSHGIDIAAKVSRHDFERLIAEDLARIACTMESAVAQSGCMLGEIDAVFLTGGTSFVPAVRRLFTDRFGPARLHVGNAFQSVASGLALLAADRHRGASPATMSRPGRRVVRAAAI